MTKLETKKKTVSSKSADTKLETILEKLVTKITDYGFNDEYGYRNDWADGVRHILKQFLTTVYTSAKEEGREEAIREITKRIDYIKKFRLNSNYKSGFSGNESGECCDKCKINEKEIIESGRAVGMRLLLGCKDPFQVECDCHIKYRKVATMSELHLLEELLSHLTPIKSLKKK